MRSFIHSKVMEAVPNFKFRYVTLTTPSLGANLLCFGNEQVDEHVMVSVCTKYEVSIFGHSKDIKGVPKFRKWSRT